MTLEILNQKILNEADEILYRYELYDLLKKYGKPFITGSYLLKLMTWRDLDIYLKLDSMNSEKFFELGNEIMIKLDSHKMNYRNELLAKTPHLPKGLYWGIHTMLFDEKWKIDIWGIDSEQYKQKLTDIKDISTNINGIHRNSILSLKSQLHSHPLYRKKFFSKDIYDSVIYGQIQTLEEFKVWLYKKKEIKI